MDAAEFQKVARNITAALIHIDPFEAFPSDDQAGSRVRFRDNPYEVFLRCGDEDQRRIADILMRDLGPDIIELCVLFEEDTRRQMGA